MNFELEDELSRISIIKEVNILKNQIDDIRPLQIDIEQKIMQKFRLDWNYHSNAIEGNRLNYGESITFLTTGVTAKGKPFQDHLDLRGHDDAISYLLTLIQTTEPISEIDINVLHKMILAESNKSYPQKYNGLPALKQVVFSGDDQNVGEISPEEGFYYSNNNDSIFKMRRLIAWYKEAGAQRNLHPLVIASLFHQKLMAVNAFEEANGKMARMLMNFILMQNDYPPVIIKMEDRQKYYSLMNNLDADSDKLFVEYIAGLTTQSLEIYLNANTGHDIDDDVDRELAMFVMDLQNKSLSKSKATSIEINNTVINTIVPLVENILAKTALIEEFFDHTDKKINMVCLKTNKKPNEIEIKDIHFVNHMADKMIRPVLKLENKIMRLEFNIHFRKFKTEEKKFDVRSTLFMKFDEYEYSLSNYNNEMEICKSYNEVLSVDDTNTIIRTLIRDIKKYMQERIR